MTLGHTFVQWALAEPSIRVVIMIGSRAHEREDIGAADEWSDWDFQIVLDRPELVAKGTCFYSPTFPAPLVISRTNGRLRRATKVTAVFGNGELDVVLLPLRHMQMLRALCRLRLGGRVPRARVALSDLSLVLRSGYQLLKGAVEWSSFFERVATKVVPTRLSDFEIKELSDDYICNYVSIVRKVQRGELIAAQRWLHCNLAEINFRLLHELRLRRGEITFPDARRLEKLNILSAYQGVAVNALLDRHSLNQAVESSADTFRNIMTALLGPKWRWPALPLRLRGE